MIAKTSVTLPARSARNFAIRRFGRLFPLLIFSTAVYVLIPNLHALAKHVLVALGHQNMFASPTSSGYYLPSGAEILATLTMTHGLGIFDKAILNYVSWSISTEFYTYMLFAGVCIAISGRVRLAAFALLSVVSFLITCWASLAWHDCIANVECLNITYDFGLTRCIASFFMGCLAFHAARFATRHESALQACALLAAGRVQAWVAGPGMGTADDSASILGAVLGTDLPVLVDADGLTLLAERDNLRELSPAAVAADAPPLDAAAERVFIDVE